MAQRTKSDFSWGGFFDGFYWRFLGGSTQKTQNPLGFFGYVPGCLNAVSAYFKGGVQPKCVVQTEQEAQLLLGDRRRESMPRIAEMDVEMTT